MVDAKTTSYKLGAVKDSAAAAALCEEMLRAGLMRRVEIVEAPLDAADDAAAGGGGGGGGSGRTHSLKHEGKRVLQAPPPPRAARAGQQGQPEWVGHQFEANGGSRESRTRYVWDVEDRWSKWRVAGILLAVLAVCMYQLWPPLLRDVVWWISVTLLLAILLATLAQFLVFAVCWLFGWSVWIIPNFWVENSFVGMFKPLIDIEPAGKGQVWTRLLMAAAFAAFGVWAWNAPAEIQALLDTQRQMVQDLYAGKLLGDGASDLSSISTISGAARPR